MNLTRRLSACELILIFLMQSKNYFGVHVGGKPVDPRKGLDKGVETVLISRVLRIEAFDRTFEPERSQYPRGTMTGANDGPADSRLGWYRKGQLVVRT